MDKMDKRQFINDYNERLKARNVDMTLLDVAPFDLAGEETPRPVRQGLVQIVTHDEAWWIKERFGLLKEIPDVKCALLFAQMRLLSHLYSQEHANWHTFPLPSGCLTFQIHNEPLGYCFRFEW